VPDGGPQGEREGDSQSFFQPHGDRALRELEKAIVAGRLKDRNKMERRLGKIQARHPQVNDLYDLDLRETADGVRLFWQMKEDRRNWREAREGAYLLRTNLTAETAEELWSKYMQLTEAEASFRALKSELSIRPLFHQLEPRVKAHVMVAFLDYALWVTLNICSSAGPLLCRSHRQVVSTMFTDNTDESHRPAIHSAERRHRSAHHNGHEIRLRRITEQPQSRNRYSASSESTCLNIFDFSANVVQTRPLLN